MNEISNKILSKVVSLSNFWLNLDQRGLPGKVNPIDRKIFYLFENDKSKKSKKSSSENDGPSSSKIIFSIREITGLDT